MSARSVIGRMAPRRPASGSYGPGAPPIPRYDDKLDDEIEVAQQELDWLIPVLEEITATVDLVQRCLRERRRGDAAEAIGELFRLWQSYRLDAHGNLLDDEGQVYAHLSDFDDDD